MGYLKFCFECVYDAESVARIVMKVESLLQRMYTAYDDHVPDGDGLKVHQNNTSLNVGNEKSKRRLLESYLHQQKMEITEMKNDLDRYLTDEPLNPMATSLDILLWWKDNSESTSGRILDPFRSSLSPKMVEALVCTQSWLKGQQGGLKLDSYVDETNSYQFIEEENADHATEKNKKVTKNIHIIDE
ncbi:hypothetical protein POM88_000379 [Heracleum sosnowskyi]|uniref:HAT C-terminal dimerisation domain-containing protein n=1 Tax=Heracleum sosnowskyi TaxID=360622 RepID=A0AAD8N8M7_9APIA|nr:hypothetical protein POM88_000379 [Heracleum sosnowskyi]